MSKTTVVNVKGGGQCDVYIGRPTKWGNPFRFGHGQYSRRQAVEQYKQWLLKQPQLLSMIPTLRGKRLGCYCAPLPCHGDVLAELADCPECEGGGWIGDGLAVVQCGCRR